jgi:hypothetical protein
MKAQFENGGQIFHIGNGMSCCELDTTGGVGSSACAPNHVAIGIYQRDLVDRNIIRYVSGCVLTQSEARAMASALLSSATEAKGPR